MIPLSSHAMLRLKYFPITTLTGSVVSYIERQEAGPVQNVNASGLWAGLSSSHIVQGRLTVASLWQTPSSPPAGLSWAQLRGWLRRLWLLWLPPWPRLARPAQAHSGTQRSLLLGRITWPHPIVGHACSPELPFCPFCILLLLVMQSFTSLVTDLPMHLHSTDVRSAVGRW